MSSINHRFDFTSGETSDASRKIILVSIETQRSEKEKSLHKYLIEAAQSREKIVGLNVLL